MLNVYLKNGFFLVLVLAITGCQGQQFGTVTGLLNVDGSPLGGFDVYFVPVSGGGQVQGSAGLDGKFKLFRGRGVEKIPVGEYRVYVAATDMINDVPMPKVKLASEFTVLGEATIIKEIKAGENDFTLDVKSVGKK